MSDEPKAIQGTRRTAKEMADGTLRVQIDVEPRDKKAFHALFPEIDMPVAIAPLKIGPQQAGSWPGDIIHIDGKAAEVMMERMTPGQIISDPRLHDYGQQAKELRQSDFFRRPEVWRAVGTDQEFLD